MTAKDQEKLAAKEERLKLVAERKVAPRDMKEAKDAIAYLDAQAKAKSQARLEAARAKLALERGTGTIAHVRRSLEGLGDTASRARIELERRARKAVGGTVRGLFRALTESDEEVAQELAAEQAPQEMRSLQVTPRTTQRWTTSAPRSATAVASTATLRRRSGNLFQRFD